MKLTRENTALNLSKLTEGELKEAHNFDLLLETEADYQYFYHSKGSDIKILFLGSRGRYEMCTELYMKGRNYNLVDFNTFKSIHFPELLSVESAYKEHWDYFKDKVDDYGFMWFCRYEEDNIPSDLFGDEAVERVFDYSEELAGQRLSSLKHLGYPEGIKPKIISEPSSRPREDDKPTYEDLTNMLQSCVWLLNKLDVIPNSLREDYGNILMNSEAILSRAKQ